MELLTATKEQIFDLFNSGLEKQINSEVVRHYIVRVMTDMTDSNLKLDTKDSVIGAKIRKARNEELLTSLTEIADSLLFLCGFFPEHFVNFYRKRAVGLSYYLKQGKIAYGRAGEIFKTNDIRQLSNLMFNLSENFIYYTNSMFNLRNSLNGSRIPIDENIVDKLYRETKNKALLILSSKTFLNAFDKVPNKKYSN